MRISNRKRIARTTAVLAMATTAAALPMRSVMGATDTFVGNNPNPLFSTGFNPPISSGDTLVFGIPGGGGTTVQDDITGLSLGGNGTDGIDFNASASAYTINRPGGQVITLASSNGGLAINDTSLNAETISVPLTLSSAQTINVGSRMGSLTLSGAITGAQTLSLSGLGLLTLSGTNGFTNLSVTGGTLAVGADANLGSTTGTVTLDGGTLRVTTSFTLAAGRGIVLGGTTSGGTIDVNSGITATYNGVIADGPSASNLTKTGLGILALSKANTYSGVTNVNEGTLQLNFGAAGAPASNILSSNTSVVLGGPVTALGLLGQANITPTLLVSGAASANNSQTINGLTLNQGENAVTATSGTSGTVTLNLGAITHNFGGVVTFNLPAGGSITTTAANDASGIIGGFAITNTAGVPNYAVSAGSAGSPGAISSYTYTAGQTLTGAITSSPNTNILSSGANTVAGTVDINTLKTGNTLTLATGAVLRFGVNGGLMNTTATTNTISGGTLTAGGPNPGTPGELTFLQTGANNNVIGFNLSSAIADNGTGGTVTVTYAAPAGFTAGSSSSIASVTTASTYTGGTYIDGGRVALGNTTGFGSGPVYVAAGAQLYLTSNNVANPLFIAGGGTTLADTPAAVRLNNETLQSSITLVADAAIGGAGGTLSGQITGNYNLTLGRTGTGGAAAGTITVSNTNNNYTGNTILSEGTVQLGNSNVIPDGAGFGDLVLSSTVGGATFNLNGKSETINGLSSATATVGTGTVTNSATGASVLTLGNADHTAVFNGSVTDSGTGKTLAITKTGAGTQTFGGNNTYSGATTINAGTLMLSNNGTVGSLGSTAVTVGGTSNGTLQIGGTGATYNIGMGTQAAGTGSASVSLTANSGTLSLFNAAVNTLNINTAAGTGLAINGGNNLDFDVASASADQIAVSANSSATASGSSVVNINLLSRASSTQTYTLINAPGGASAINGGAFTLGTPTGVSSFGLGFALATTANTLTLTETVAPTPSVAYFVGNLGTSWSANNGSTSNFSSDSGGQNLENQLPGAGTVVHFYATNATTANVAASTLDGPFVIDSLIVDGSTLSENSPVGIASGTGGAASTLTLTPANSANGITVNAGAGAVTISAPVVFGANQTVTNSSGNVLTLSGGISDGGAARTVTLAATGTTGVITITGGAGTIVNGTTFNIASGTVNANNTNTLGSLAIVNVADGATLSVGATQTIGALNTSGASNSGTVVLGGNTLTVGSTNNLNSTFNGTLNGGATGTLTKTGTGTLTIGGSSNTLRTLNINSNSTVDIGSGSLTINNGGGGSIQSTTGGTLNGSGGGTLTISANTTTPSNGGDVGTAAGTTLTINAKIVGTAGLDFYGPSAALGTTVLTGANTYQGPTNIQAQVASVASIGSWSASNTTPSNFGSPTTSANGTLSIGNGTNAAGLIYTGAGETTNRIINLAGTTGAASITQSGAGPGTGTGVLDFTAGVTAAGAGIKTLTLQGSTAGAGQIDGPIVDNSSTNTTALAKAGTGTWTLTGANTYSGGTTVSAGTLLVSNASGSGTGPGAVTVATAGTLGGKSGTIGGVVTVNGTITGGTGAAATASPGQLTTTGGNGTTTFSQTWVGGTGAAGTGGTYAWKLNYNNASTSTSNNGQTLDANNTQGGTNWDLLSMTSLNVTGNANTFNITMVPVNGTPVTGQQFNSGNGYQWAIADVANGVSASLLAKFQLNAGGFAAATNTTASQYSLGIISDGTASGDDIVISYSPAPEPTSLLMLGLGAGGLMLRRRRAVRG